MSFVLGENCALGSCPAGCMAEVGLRWCGGDRRITKGDPDDQGKSKRKPASSENNSKTKIRNSVKRTTPHVTKPAVHQRPRFASQPTALRESKTAHIIAMLRAPGGATIEAMARAAKWQPHSVRGFLAGVVRKKLGLTLVSADGENGRVYQVTDRTASTAA